MTTTFNLVFLFPTPASIEDMFVLYHKQFCSADIWVYTANSDIISKTSWAVWISVRHKWSDKLQEMLNSELSQNIERCIPAHYFSSCLIYVFKTSKIARANVPMYPQRDNKKAKLLTGVECVWK